MIVITVLLKIRLEITIKLRTQAVFDLIYNVAIYVKITCEFSFLALKQQ